MPLTNSSGTAASATVWQLRQWMLCYENYLQRHYGLSTNRRFYDASYIRLFTCKCCAHSIQESVSSSILTVREKRKLYWHSTISYSKTKKQG